MKTPLITTKVAASSGLLLLTSDESPVRTNPVYSRLVTRIVLLGLLLCAPFAAYANPCVVRASSVSITPGTVSVDASNVPVGSAFSGWIGLVRGNPVFNCPLPGIYVDTYLQTTITGELSRVWDPEAGWASLYPSGIPGVGMIFRAADNGIYPTGGPGVLQGERRLTYRGILVDIGYAAAIKFYRTGDITGGSSYVPGRQVAALSMTVQNASYPALNSILMLAGFSVNVANWTCNATAPSTVALGRLPISTVRAAGGGTPVPFSINVACQGSTTAARKVYVTMTDATDPSNRGDILSLASGSTAAGIGIRIKKSDGNVVSYGAASSTIGNPNQWEAGEVNTPTPNLQIQLTAQMIPTGPPVTEGTVQGIVTFTMAYQ